MTNLTVTNVDPRRLKPNAWNTNVVSPANEQKIEASLKRFGFFKPILVREINGAYEVLGGQHRWEAAIRLGYSEVPIINLGALEDTKAKEISLVDNGRYGEDDTLQLAQLLGELGPRDDLATFMPFDDRELEQIFSSVNIALDSLELDEKDEKPSPPPTTRKVQEFQIMRFKVPVEDAALVTDVIGRYMTRHKFVDDDSLTNAGLALVQLCKENE